MRTFQFPSNGKVYLKVLTGISNFTMREFQFPSNGKVYLKPMTRSEINAILFQFPSNGKVYLKVPQRARSAHLTTKVSIPFKRESVSQDGKNTVIIEYICFNSLQTGKCISSRIPRWCSWRIAAKCFNSLQTGKRITRN